jgi:hypothetical protein
MVKSSMTGLLLADLISRVKGKEKFILMGNSLGCRVIFYALNALSTKERINIINVDVSHIVDGHLEYKPNLERILKEI